MYKFWLSENLTVYQFNSVQSLTHARPFATPWTAACQASLCITNPWSLLRLMSMESVMPSHHLILCCPLLLPPSIFPSIRVFSNESVLHIRWPKYWSFSFSIRPFNEYSGQTFRIDWLDLLAVQGTLKSLLQHTVQKHQFFGTQYILLPFVYCFGVSFTVLFWSFLIMLSSPLVTISSVIVFFPLFLCISVIVLFSLVVSMKFTYKYVYVIIF